MTNAATNVANEALSDFVIAGYDVIIRNPATKQDVIDALNDPCARAIHITGHSVKDTSIIKMSDGGITADPAFVASGEAMLVPSNPNLNYVRLNSCFQFQQIWIGHFPGAFFSSQEFWANQIFLFWYEWFNRIPPIDP